MRPTTESMQTPWRTLKDTELEALRQRRNGNPLPSTISRLRKLLAKCGQDADAESSICYHGSLSMLFEFDLTNSHHKSRFAKRNLAMIVVLVG